MDRKKLEYMLLGKLIVFNENIEYAINSGVKTEWFSDENTRQVFRQIEEMWVLRGSFEMTELDISEELLESLYSYGEIVTSVEKTVDKLRTEYRKEEFHRFVKETLEDDGMGTEEKITNLQTMFDRIQDVEDEKYEVLNPGNLLNEWMNNIRERKMNGVRSPFENMRGYFNFIGGQLIVIGARPSMGKTAIGLTFFKETAKKHRSLFVNLEMNKDELLERMLAGESDVALNRLKSAEQTDLELKRVSRAFGVISQLRCEFLNCLCSDFEVIVSKIRLLHKKESFSLIVIDYLTMMRTRKRFQNRNLEVEYMANQLKLLAKELNTCIIVLAQLNRNKEANGGKNKKPEMSDLRDSGGIEQAADVIGLLYREDYYDDEQKKADFVILEMLIRKNRQGRTGEIEFGFQKSSQRITG